MQILPIFIEKDYWVTYALQTIFNHATGSDTVFKGGTALSKCYKMIDRFSEDIDLVVLRREGESNNRLTTKIRTISDVVSAVLPEVNIEGLTQKGG
jgi:predicted nucleotidyltransferase component of viral defense system